MAVLDLVSLSCDQPLVQKPEVEQSGGVRLHSPHVLCAICGFDACGPDNDGDDDEEEDEEEENNDDEAENITQCFFNVHFPLSDFALIYIIIISSGGSKQASSSIGGADQRSQFKHVSVNGITLWNRLAPRHRWNHASPADLDRQISPADLIHREAAAHSLIHARVFFFNGQRRLVITF
ncbi:unnamed protein product [Pleuronectes platessa]|uniref:Uncharacterized protein n=1 Tax=Pleuronectes platessa TaxID=8262 RepID=A0A9N7YRX2_PLEPL|nr:unnamed protein product [Pleuronectes platessa]